MNSLILLLRGTRRGNSSNPSLSINSPPFDVRSLYPKLDFINPSLSTSQIILFLFNVRSLYPKLDFLKIECVDRKPDIVCLTETWLDNGITNDEFSIPGFNQIRLDRNRHEGGVALYINVNFAFKVIYLSGEYFKCVIVCFLIGCCKICVCLF